MNSWQIISILLVCMRLATSRKGFIPYHRQLLQCYYPAWSVLRNNGANLIPEEIDPLLCTHLVLVYAKLDEVDFVIASQNPTLELPDSNGLGLYKRVTNIKRQNPSIKILLGIGGFLDSQVKIGKKESPVSKYSVLMSDFNRRRNFILHVIPFLKHFGFDGLEFHWEFPAASDKENFAKFIQECKREFLPHRLMLTLTLSTIPSVIQEAYDIDIIKRYVDHVQLMTYDFHGYYEGVTNYISRLYSAPTSIGTQSVDNSVKLYKELGMPPSKMLIGIASYAKSYTLVEWESHNVGSPTLGPGSEGPYTQVEGYLAYYEVCGSDWTKVDDDYGLRGAYVFRDRQWAAFNDMKAIHAKTEYVIAQKLKGIAFWSLDQDDFEGSTCGPFQFPLITTAKLVLLTSNQSTDVTPGLLKAHTFLADRCVVEGLYPDRTDCRKFYNCKKGILKRHACGENLYWNQDCLCCVLDSQHCGVMTSG